MPTTPTPMDRENLRRAVPAQIVQYPENQGMAIPRNPGNYTSNARKYHNTSMIPTRMRPKSLTVSIHTVDFEKGPGRKGLGFSVVGGIDSPKGSIGK